MTVIDTTIIPQAQQQSGRATGQGLPDGLNVGRLEPIVDAADWDAGMQVTLWAEVFDASNTSIAKWQNTVSKSVDRNNNPIMSNLQILAPFPSAGFSMSCGFSADRLANIGLRFTAAPDVGSLPAPLPAPG